MNTLYAFLIFLAALSGTSSSAIAATGASDWQKTEQTEVRLIAATQSIGTDGALRLGLHFRLQPGWKVYWRSPGDAGFPPQLEWNGSSNLKSATLQWPAPKRFSVLGIETLGYKDELVLPIIALQKTPNAAIKFEAQLRYLVCNQICIPYDTSLSLHLPTGNGEPSEFTHLINRYQSHVPGDGSVHGLKIVSSRTTETANKTTLQLALESTSPLTHPDVYFEGPDELTFTKPKITLGPDQRTALLEVNVDGLTFLEDDVGKTIKGREFTVTLVDGKQSAEQKLIIGDPLLDLTAQAPPSSSSAEVSILYILALGILGGLILNLMPCVLPILSIKILSVVGHGGSENKAVRLSFLASAAGIISSFLVLAAALTILKSAGMAVGWGIQFQYPWFLIALIILVLLFACNLWGFFEFRLPNALSQVGASGHNTDHLSSHYLQGAFATLLATPCSAPFLGTAVGFALARGTAEIFMIFLALGV
ncbi:MAG: protein-disulfide reductase DsbD family protein, partial [Rhodospirillales bacterium]|nr:protein-disulfide reductase DsbD family protein [Rhodospirillales bacterium]